MVRQNNKSKGKAGRKQDEVWEYFEKKALKSPGHFSGECKFCHMKWNRAYVRILQSHLANECVECPEQIQNYWLGYISAKDSLNDDDTASITSQESTNSKNKKRKVLNESKIASIDRALIRAFVCCGIPFSVIDSPFFRELLYQLRPNYDPPSRKKLSENLLNQEISRVNIAVKKELELSENLTLDHSIATKILAACNTIAKFFKTSHIGHNLLSECAKNLEIKGGGLKCFIKTRWTSMYEATYSIVRMKRALEEVMTKHPEKITNAVVKKILKKQLFYDQVNTLAKLLRPIKNAILMLEGDQANLADAFIQMVRLAYTIKNFKVNNLVGFQQHAIQAFNKRWEEFDISLYLLAYFLHPKFRTNGLKAGKYSLITSAAGRIWKSMGNDQNSCEDLYLQMRNSKYSERELKIMVDESLNDIEEDFEDDEPERVLVEQHEIPNHIVSVLILEDIFDIKDVPFIKDPEDDDDDSESESENEHEIDENNVDNVNPTEENDDNDYDVDALAAKYLD
ncbi:unnamed protein product [Rhizophagus irregularis]|uniref:BED-type domain-containing protein n=1 Tax=Rhizophagus irregularis TaxID=588596 RepID=A0A915ZYP4_9GLOM|nr:unnamed protein product [Rhizophagus irregularis]